MYLIVKKKYFLIQNKESVKVRYEKAGNKINCYSFGATCKTL